MISIKKITNFLLLFLVFCLFFQECFSADDILDIKITDFEPSIEILQGKCKTAPFRIANLYNESVNIYYRIDKPSDMNITSYPKDYTLLTPGERIAGNLNICVNEYFENDTYNIKFWIETLTKVNESRVKSDKYTLGVTVLNNPDLKNVTTTSIITETTTTKRQIISTIPVYTPAVTSTIMANLNISVDINKSKTSGILLGKEKLVTMVVIVIALILILIPYLTFIRSQKSKKMNS
jgi:hypothetical protein